MEVGNLAELDFKLDTFHSSRQARPLHIFSLLPKINIEAMPNVAKDAGVNAIINELGKTVYDLTLVSARKHRHAYGFLIDHKGVWNMLIRTVESPTVAGNIANRWLDRLYPAICRSYIRPNDLLDILDALSKIEGSKLELRSYILRAHNSPETVKNWKKDKPYSRKDIEQDIQSSGKLLEAIHFLFHVEHTYFHVRMQIDGHFVFYDGGEYCFTNFQRLVLSKFNEVALMTRKFFSHRERRIVDGEAKISRIILEPQRKLEKKDLVCLSSHLGSKYSTAILHSGNPWLLVNILDREDGSSFDIHGYPSKIQVVPFNKSSPESLMRLIYSIYELFPLSRIKN